MGHHKGDYCQLQFEVKHLMKITKMVKKDIFSYSYKNTKKNKDA
jgi:hypothetical protein